MRIGVICSSGGSSFRAAFPVLSARGHRFRVVTDRPCEVEEYCGLTGVPHRRICEPDNQAFSKFALDYLEGQGSVDIVVLFYVRLITRPLLEAVPCFNIHPSLLPAFGGFGALAAARCAGVRFFGATLHLASEDADAGPIIAQVCEPMPANPDDSTLGRHSYLHKTYLLLLLMDLLENGKINAARNWQPEESFSGSMTANPVLQNEDYRNAMREIQRAAGCEIFP